jgi:hypothetical protein
LVDFGYNYIGYSNFVCSIIEVLAAFRQVCLLDQQKLFTENFPNDKDGFHNVPMTKLVL